MSAQIQNSKQHFALDLLILPLVGLHAPEQVNRIKACPEVTTCSIHWLLCDVWYSVDSGLCDVQIT